MAFERDRYLLPTEASRSIFDRIVSLPIVDLHSHVEASRVASDQPWENLWEAWAATDHYVWELMRRLGVPEDRITGKAPPEEKWQALAAVAPRLPGNPVYDWLNLDLQRLFGLALRVGPDTAREIWERTQEMLCTSEFKPRRLLLRMNVRILCTTDSPVTDLRIHRRLQEEFPEVAILPTWRPDVAFRIGTPEWRTFLGELAERTGMDTHTWKGFLQALANTHQVFHASGCRASDHALLSPWPEPADERTAGRLHGRAVRGRPLTPTEQARFSAYLLGFCGVLNAEAGWIMQFHIGAVRDYRERLFRAYGRDSGGDVATHEVELVEGLRWFLNRFDGRLNVILYVLHPAHTYTALTLVRAFPGVYMGAPWWFLDNPHHMEMHLAEVASVDLLALHAGMVTDSRKILSYGSRTEMFRRALARFLGRLVEESRVPLEDAIALASDVALGNPEALLRGLRLPAPRRET